LWPPRQYLSIWRGLQNFCLYQYIRLIMDIKGTVSQKSW
jgi:hypothetical protein